MEKSQEQEQTDKAAAQQAEYARGEQQLKENTSDAQKHPGLHPDQEPKYTVNDKGEIVNRDTGKSIPLDEPVFILRAQDKHALSTLRNYVGQISGDGHRTVVSERIAQFEAFAQNNPTRMKDPDSTPAAKPDLTSFQTKPAAA